MIDNPKSPKHPFRMSEMMKRKLRLNPCNSRLVRIPPLITTAALLAALAIGCSKHSDETPMAIHVNQDLGDVQFVTGMPKHFSLGGPISCTAIGSRLPDGIKIDFVIEATHPDGAVDTLSRPSISTPPGQHCVITSGDVTIGLTPTMKAP